jgi:hypothetical protein
MTSLSIGSTYASLKSHSTGWLYWALLLIGIVTMLSGAIQMVSPQFVLNIIGAHITETASYSFGIVGMFMLLFGGILTHGLRAKPQHPQLIFWASLQKFGAAIAVFLGVQREIFAPLALAVALFDLLSGFLALWYWKRLAAH